MEFTGIIRRVDDLGRIAIPKEIRQSIGIAEGDPIEFIVVDNSEIVLKPYLKEVVAEVQQFEAGLIYRLFERGNINLAKKKQIEQTLELLISQIENIRGD